MSNTNNIQKVITFGCRLNTYESAIIKNNLQISGLENVIVLCFHNRLKPPPNLYLSKNPDIILSYGFLLIIIVVYFSTSSGSLW